MPAVNATAERFYPNVSAVAAELDQTVLAEPDYSDDEESPQQIGVLFHIGRRAELAAGLWSSQVTPHFSSLEDLEAFCVEHRAQFDALAEMDVWPPKLFWEQ
jgi:hypothetical protein